CYSPCPVRILSQRPFPNCIPNIKHHMLASFSLSSCQCWHHGSVARHSRGWWICHPSVAQLRTCIHVVPHLRYLNGPRVKTSIRKNTLSHQRKRRSQLSVCWQASAFSGFCLSRDQRQHLVRSHLLHLLCGLPLASLSIWQIGMS